MRACACVFSGLLTLSGVSLYIRYSQKALEETERRMGREQMAQGVHIIRLVYGHGLDLLSSGGDHWSSPTAGCQAGAFNPVWRVCHPHIETHHLLEMSISGKVVSICQGKVSSLSYIVRKTADVH